MLLKHRHHGAATAMLMLAAIFLFSGCPQPTAPEPEPPIEEPDPDPDPTLPGGMTVLSVNPAANGTPIDLHPTFQVRFDRDLAHASIADGLRLLKNGTPLPSTLYHFDEPGSRQYLSLEPENSLDYGATYVLVATTKTRSTSGESLSAEQSWTFVAKAPMRPSLSAYRASTMFTSIPDGSWTNDDVRAEVSRPSAYPGGTLSILWSLDGETWAESTGVSAASATQTISTADGDHLRLKARYVYEGQAYESIVHQVHVDKVRPSVIAYDGTVPGRLLLELSEPVYRSTQGDAPIASSFQLQSVEHWGAQFTVTAVSGSGVSWTIDYTYRDSDGDHIEIIAAGMDLAGNPVEWRETDIVTLRAPIGYAAQVDFDGMIMVIDVEGRDFGDRIAVAAPTTDTDYGLTWTTAGAWGTLSIYGLNPEMRYYLRVANAIGTVGRSKGVKAPSFNAPNYRYPVVLFNEGAGTEADPWRIRNRADLEAMLDTEATSDDHYALAANIDLSRYPWSYLGRATHREFTGSLDGDGYAITGAPDKLWNGGIFGYTRDAEIRDLVIRNVKIDGDYAPQGALVNEAFGATVLEGVAVENFSVEGGSWTGGLVGRAGDWPEDDNAIQIRRCYAQGSIVRTDQGYAGGLVGSATGASIEDCFAAVDILEATRDSCAGFLGEIRAGTVIRRSYASGAVDTTSRGAGLVRSRLVESPKPIMSDLVAMNPMVGKAGYDSTYNKRYRAISADISSSPLSNYVVASGIYANSAMLVDGAIVADSDVNGTGMTLAAFKSSASPCFANWDFTTSGPWTMTASGPMLKAMPLGGGAFGIPSIDPVAWD